jgi:hypothetical protein
MRRPPQTEATGVPRIFLKKTERQASDLDAFAINGCNPAFQPSLKIITVIPPRHRCRTLSHHYRGGVERDQANVTS